MERYILTAQAEALSLAIAEVGHPRVIRELSPGVALCVGTMKLNAPIFLRHMCPAEAQVTLRGGMEDIGALRDALVPLLPALDTAQGFSVQTRIIDGYQPAYKRFDVNTALCEAAQETGAPLDVKNPAQVISVTLTQGAGWIGISNAADNLSGWAGGARRFKWEDSQVSRAEFKLLEALEVFGIVPPKGGRALDLGAAPGGWTRVLRERGMRVTAVDPAALDPRIEKDPLVTHYRGTAQAYFRKPGVFDLMVNDMKMDTEQSAQLMVEGARCLSLGGAALLTLKLPEDVTQWKPRIEKARQVLAKAYSVTSIRQLFHNRCEVTVALSNQVVNPLA